MKRSKPKIIVKPHYIGTDKDKEILRRILQDQIERKLKANTASVVK